MDNGIDLQAIPKCQANSMAAEIFRGMKEFFDDPENMAKFLEWKKGKEESNGPAYAPIPV